MTTETFDKERLRASVWKIEKLNENISDIDKLLFALSEIKTTTTFTIGPKAKGVKYSTIEDVITKREWLQEEKRIKIFELQIARFELSNELDVLYSHLWPGTIQMVKDYYIASMNPGDMKKKYGQNYIWKVRKITA